MVVASCFTLGLLKLFILVTIDRAEPESRECAILSCSCALEKIRPRACDCSGCQSVPKEIPAPRTRTVVKAHPYGPAREQLQEDMYIQQQRRIDPRVVRVRCGVRLEPIMADALELFPWV